MSYLGSVFRGTSLAGGNGDEVTSPHVQDDEGTKVSKPPYQDVITQPGVTRTVTLPNGRTITITSSFRTTTDPTPTPKPAPSDPQPPAETKEQVDLSPSASQTSGMSTTTKVLLGIGVVAVVGFVGYLIWKSAKASAMAGLDLDDEDDLGSCPCQNGG